MRLLCGRQFRPYSFHYPKHHLERCYLRLYGSNRGHDSIAVFAIDEAGGKLTAVERTSTQGKTPRSFAIDPTGQFLFAVNQNTNNLVLFRIDQQTGGLTQAGESLQVPSPVCVKFVKVG